MMSHGIGTRCEAPGPEGERDGIGPEVRSLVQAYVAYLSDCEACTIDALREAYATEGDRSRLQRLPTWRRAPLRTYTDRERMALAWAEVVAISGEEGIGEALRCQGLERFSAGELIALTRIVTAARGWRRLLLERTAGPKPRPRSRRGGPCRTCATARCEEPLQLR